MIRYFSYLAVQEMDFAMTFVSALLLSAAAGMCVSQDSAGPVSFDIKGADMAVYSLYMDHVDSDYGKAMEYAEIFLCGLDSSDSDPEAGFMCDRLAAWYENGQSSFSKAIEWKSRALRHYELEGMEKEEASARYSLAKLYYRRGEYHRSLQYITDARSGFERFHDRTSMMECDNLLGGVYFACGDYANAYGYFQKYAMQAREAGDSVRLCVALNNLAAYQSITDDTLRTGRFIEEALEISRMMNDTLLLCRSLLNLSSFNINHGRYAEAAECLGAARQYIADISHEGQYWMNWCILLRKTGKVSAANDSLMNAVKCYGSGEFDMELKKCYNLMISNYGELSDTLSMYAAAWKYHEVAERISDRETDLQLFQYQNEIIRQKEAEKSVERKALRNIYATIFFSLLMVAGMGIWLYGRNRKFLMRRKEDELEKQLLINRQHEQEIRSKNEILEIKKLEKYKTERIVLEMTEKFLALCNESKDRGTCRRIMQICSEIRHSMEGEMNDINNFVPEFNSDFFRKLLKAFPDLTVNERRLCALLHMNLSTKEISEITRQSPHSINIARGRLRNKLGLKGSRLSLQEFLTSVTEEESDMQLSEKQ